MEKNQCDRMIYFFYHSKVNFVCIRLCLFITLLSCLTLVPAFASSLQDVRISLHQKDVSYQKIFNEIESKTGFSFLIRNNDLNTSEKTSISATNKTVEEILKMLFAEKDITYEVKGNKVSVYKPAKVVTDGKGNKIAGKVVDENQEPIIGASVMILNTTQGTVTDLDGNFELEAVSGEAKLQVSFIGYKSRILTWNGRSVLKIVLQEDNKLLDEIVVVGYGTQKKGNLTGAISTIKTEEITTTTHSSLAQSLQGKLPGLQIRQQSGEPGEFNTDINIRGFGQPLYVIDGIVRDGSGEFQRLSPNDIENISILKDASAAIYGLNAANGVILVTTKKGIAGRPKFSYNGVFGWQKPTDIPKMANAAQYLEMTNDANVNVGGNPSITREELQKWQHGLPGYESTDWYKEAIRNSAPITQHDFSVRGGNEAVNYYLSFGYLGEKGLLKSNEINYNKYTVRSNVTAKLNKYLTADVMISGRIDSREYPGDNFYWIFKGTRVSLPTERPYANSNTKYPAKVTLGTNPVLMSYKDKVGYGESKNKAFQSSASLTYNAPFLDGLQVKGTVAYDSNNTLGKNLVKKHNVYTYISETDTYLPEAQNDPSWISNAVTDNNRLVLQAQLSYDHTFAKAHHVGATLVYEQKKEWLRYSWLKRQYEFYTNDQINQAAKNNQETDGYEDEKAFMSYIGRLNYDYLGKYLIEYAFRYDGSYRYAPGSRWGFFPVVSAGWRISEESFIKNNLHFVDNLKIRASYGTVGENAGDPFQYILGFSTTGGGFYEFSDGSFTSGAASPGIVNPNLTWYKSKIKDVGIDIGLFNGALNMEFDVYQRDRTGLLSKRNLSLPNTFGGSLPEENLNSDRVQGLDFVISHHNKINDFYYGLSFNFNFARTKKIYTERAPYRSSWDKWKNGNTDRWQDVLWGYDQVGQYQSREEIIHAPVIDTSLGNTRVLPGDYIYRDANGDGLIDAKDQLPLFWGGQPKLHYGFTVNAQWKGFDLNMLFQGSGKYTVRFNEVYSEILCFKGNTPAYFYDRWHLSDPYDSNSEWVPGKWPAVRYAENMTGNYRESQIWRRDASYLRLKSLEIGYTIPSKYTKKYFLESVRIYGNAHNLLTFADSFVKPFDPEKIEGNYNAGLNYPLTKNFNVGINVTF